MSDSDGHRSEKIAHPTGEPGKIEQRSKLHENPQTIRQQTVETDRLIAFNPMELPWDPGGTSGKQPVERM